jgi:serine protease AprX
MATQVNQPERGRAKRSNPIAHVTYQSRDLSGVEVTGGSTKELVPVTADLRHALQASMSQAGNVIAAEAGANPDIPGVMVIKLRDVAIAKSHRPTELIAAAGMPPAGHGQIDEMLVAVNPVSLAQLNNVLGQRDTKKIRANISAVESFEAWDIQRRLPKQFRGTRCCRNCGCRAVA